MRIYIVISVLLMSLLPIAAAAQQEPPESDSSLAITIQQLEEDVQNLTIRKFGIVLHTVLPRGWELAEQGVDRQGNLLKDTDRVILLSRAPVADAKDSTDCIVEYTIYQHKLMEGFDQTAMDKAAWDEEASKQKWLFLDGLMSHYLKLGFDCQTRVNEIEPKPYGTGETRALTVLIPIRFEEPGGAMLYTFTGFYGDTIYTVSFLVTKSQIENYKGLIGFIINNTFALTEAEYVEKLAEQGVTAPPAE